jgi:hypothetical protein
MAYRYLRHQLRDGQIPHDALGSLRGATGLIVRIDSLPDRTEVMVATESESYEEAAERSELGAGVPVDEAAVTSFAG